MVRDYLIIKFKKEERQICLNKADIHSVPLLHHLKEIFENNSYIIISYILFKYHKKNFKINYYKFLKLLNKIPKKIQTFLNFNIKIYVLIVF